MTSPWPVSMMVRPEAVTVLAGCDVGASAAIKNETTQIRAAVVSSARCFRMELLDRKMGLGSTTCRRHVDGVILRPNRLLRKGLANFGQQQVNLEWLEENGLQPLLAGSDDAVIRIVA